MVKNLWKGNRGAGKETRRDQSDSFPPVDPNYETVGETLRKQREERGEDLRYVAQILRIRYPYLKAIEDGRPDELPGPTYAVGFVRTYADHLGLESERMVQRFKEEAAGFQSRADLHFPAPLPEGKIPSGAVLVVAVVLAASIYSAWIYFSSRDQQVAEIVPQLPNRISDIIKGKPGTEAPAAAPAAQPETKQAETPPAAKPVERAVAEKPKSEPPANAPAPAPAAAGPPTSSAPAESETAASSQSSIPNPPPFVAGPSESEVTPPPSPIAQTPDTPSASESADAPSSDGPPALTEAERAPPKVYGEENGNARIVIHAAADSWVEVRDSATDELLLTRVLFKGDRYQVPDRGGLTLLTGNAGGLRIIVDGTDAPPIGPLGAVRRNVALEPAPLLSGNAARAGDNGTPRTDNQTSEGTFTSQ